jgi:hypothetical protein
MPGIKESLLQTALTELDSINNRRYAAARYERIDWQEIEQQLHRLDAALSAGNEYDFHTTLASLQQLLKKQGDEWRFIIGEQQQQQSDERAAPPAVLVLINHIVDRLQPPTTVNKQTQEQPPPPKDKR